jgi:uncharacterized membrane protein YuzA (DUF378 family)
MARSIFDWIAVILLIVGGLNWGLFGLFSMNLVESIFGSIAWLAKAAYAVIGLSALYTIFYLVRE